jgi:hypothetical protein
MSLCSGEATRCQGFQDLGQAVEDTWLLFVRRQLVKLDEAVPFDERKLLSLPLPTCRRRAELEASSHAPS